MALTAPEKESTAESTATLAPSGLIYDRAADSDPLRRRLAERGIELICPHRQGRVRAATQDGRGHTYLSRHAELRACGRPHQYECLGLRVTCGLFDRRLATKHAGKNAFERAQLDGDCEDIQL